MFAISIAGGLSAIIDLGLLLILLTAGGEAALWWYVNHRLNILMDGPPGRTGWY